MALRAAATNDVWRHLYQSKPRPIESITVNYRDTANGPIHIFTLNAPLSLFCGENGVGKSRAMRALHTALGGGFHDSDFRPEIGPISPEVSSVSAVFRSLLEAQQVGDQVLYQDTSSLADALKDSSGACKIHWFDPTVQIPYLLHLLRHDSALTDLWEGVSPRKLNAEELADVSSMVGRHYDLIEIFEVADYAKHEVVPYFRATTAGSIYGAENMGLGELSILFLYWMLNRIGFGSVLLLEEPETFIAPKAQRALVDIIAKEAHDKSLFVVITSHSGVVTERVPSSHVDLVSRMGSEVTFLRCPPRNILGDRLGLVPPKSIVMLVEDTAAALFAKALLETGNSRYVNHCGIFVAGGESEITSVLKGLTANNSSGVTIIGVYDGDQRRSLPKFHGFPTMCLPGNFAPERVAQEFLSSNRSNIENVLKRPRAKILTAVAAVAGLNHHDWIVALCGSLQISMEEFFRCIVEGLNSTSPQLVTSFIYELDGKGA